ncbi:hypothetical protein LINPERHAP1_LOCUS43470 [Linum perenne]
MVYALLVPGRVNISIS